MNIALINQATMLRGHDEEVARIAYAVNRQLTQHLAGSWGRAMPTCVLAADEKSAPAGSWFIYILDNQDDGLPKNVGGYHSENPKPYGKAFCEPVLSHGGTISKGSFSVSVTISHEAVEMAIDATVNEWWGDNRGNLYAAEACDPVEADWYNAYGDAAHSAGGLVAVSDFILPAWRDPFASVGPFNWNRTLNAPFSMRPRGYVIKMVEGKATPVYGDEYPVAKKQEKMAKKGRTWERLSNGVPVEVASLG